MNFMNNPLLLMAIIGAVIVIYAVFSTLIKMFQKVGPNEVLVVSGRGGIDLVTGGGRIVIPFLNKAERFSLEIMTIDIVTPEVYTKQGVKIIVDAVAQVKVRNDEKMIRTAVERFLTKTPGEIVEIIKQTLEGHTRAIIGRMQVEEIIKERDKFASAVAEIAHDDLANMGLGIDSFAVRDIKDNMGYLEALGKPETSKVKKEATIAEAENLSESQRKTAEAQKEAQVAQANAAKESQIAQAVARKDAEVAQASAQRDAEIARLDAKTKVAEKDKEYKIKQAEYNAQSKQKEAEADLAYDLQRNITQQQVKEQEIRINVVEKERQVEVQEKEVMRREKELEATIKKPAEAQQFQIETLANAKQYELKTTATGESEAVKLKGFAEAEVVRAQGFAQAEAEKAQGLARAEVIRATGFSEAEAMTKKAEAWKGYNQAAILEMFIGKMPELARSISAPLAKTEKIIMINSDGGGASKLTSDVTRAIAEIPPVMEALTGVKMSDMLKNIPGMGGGPVETVRRAVSEVVQKPKPPAPPPG